MVVMALARAITMMMLVVVMAVIMIVRVIMIMPVMSMMRVGPAFRIERRFNRREPRSPALQHRLERGVRPHPQAIGEDLHRHMPVAKMPSKARQMRQVIAADLDERLGLDHHVDDAAIVELERVPVTQEDGLGKHRTDLRAIYTGETPGLQSPLIRLENDRVDLARTAACRMDDADNAKHLVEPRGAFVILFGIARLHRLVAAGHRRGCKRGVRLLVTLV